MNGSDPSGFIGSWKLLAFHSQNSDGETVYPLGKNVAGRLDYGSRGLMAVQLVNPDRPKFQSEDLFAASDEEVRAAFLGYVAYYGSYSVQLSKQIVTHHLTAASIPNWVGSDQKRFFEFSDDQLTLKTPPMTLGGKETVSVLIWQRYS